MFFPPIPLIRANHILDRLRACGAVSPETARTLDAAGVLNPNGFPPVTRRLLRRGVLGQTADGRFYIK